MTVLDRNLIIIIIIIIKILLLCIRVTKFLDSLFCLDKDDVDNENKDYLLCGPILPWVPTV